MKEEIIKLKQKYGDDIENDIKELFNIIDADINNKLSPIKNLIAILDNKNKIKENKELFNRLINQNILIVKETLDYLINYSKNKI